MAQIKFFLRSLHAAFSFLTRLPLRCREYTPKELAFSSAFYPLAGALFGAMLFGTGAVLKPLFPGGEVAAAILLALPYLLNRFLHFDGLCDTLDAFLADVPRERRLEIMKDSRVGSFALGGAALFLLLKWALLKELIALNAGLSAVAFLPVLSRASMTFGACRARYARENGTGAALIGNITATALTLCALFLALGTAGTMALGVRRIAIASAFGTSAVWTIFFRLICSKKIGGMTGDTLGALSESVELIAAAAILTAYRLGGL